MTIWCKDNKPIIYLRVEWGKAKTDSSCEQNSLFKTDNIKLSISSDHHLRFFFFFFGSFGQAVGVIKKWTVIECYKWNHGDDAHSLILWMESTQMDLLDVNSMCTFFSLPNIGIFFSFSERFSWPKQLGTWEIDPKPPDIACCYIITYPPWPPKKA